MIELHSLLMSHVLCFFSVWALIVSVGGGMLLVVVLVVMFVCCLKRFREKNVIKIWNEVKNKTSVDVKAMRGRTCEEKVQMPFLVAREVTGKSQLSGSALCQFYI